MLIAVTVASVSVAAVMSVVAWRASRNERLRSDARVEALARAIHAPGVDLELRAATRPNQPVLPHQLFDVSTRPPAPASRIGLALAVGAFAIASIAAMVVVFGGQPTSAHVADRVTTAASPAESNSTAAAEAAPLELIALSQEREGDELTIRGTVRNPATGAAMNQLSAVVSLIDRDGNLLSSSRVLVAAPTLIPGGETTFAVTIPNGAGVARYRVSFRSADRTINHVDKRAKS